MILIGDVGGTYTRLALMSPSLGPRSLLAERVYTNKHYTGLLHVLHDFLSEEHTFAPDGACFCVAGPVEQGRAKLTNLSWVLDEPALAQGLGLSRIKLINDLQAMALAVPQLQEGEFSVLLPGQQVSHAPIAVMAPGTGLGQAFLVCNGQGYEAMPSEGGHADFAPRPPQEMAWWQALAQRHGHVSIERACSGSALPDLFDHLCALYPEQVDPMLLMSMSMATDRAPHIVRAAVESPQKNLNALQAVQMMVDIWAAEAGNMALRYMALGGVFLDGGMPQRVRPWLDSTAFKTAFTSKGRFTEMLLTVPVSLIECNATLLGTALYAQHSWQDPK